MSTVHARKHVDLPVSTTYDHWTRFESFPEFMEGIQEVQQLTDTELRFRGEIGGVEREWTAKIVEQVPDHLIRWHSIEGPQNGGSVRFFEKDGGTEIELTMQYEPETFTEKVGDVAGIFQMRVRRDLDNFKQYAEKHPLQTGWRGEIRGGRRTK